MKRNSKQPQIPAAAQIIDRATADTVTVTRWTCEQSGGYRTDYKPVRTDYILCTNSVQPEQNITFRYTGRNISTAAEIMTRAHYIAARVNDGMSYKDAADAADNAGSLGMCHRHPDQVHTNDGSEK